MQQDANKVGIDPKPTFEEILSNLESDIHFKTLESLIRSHFDIDQQSATFIVTHLLNKSQSFVCIKRDQVLKALYPDYSEESSDEEVIKSPLYKRHGRLGEGSNKNQHEIDSKISKNVNDIGMSMDKTSNL